MSICHFAIYHTKCMVEGGRECLYVTLLYTIPSAWLREGVSVYVYVTLLYTTPSAWLREGVSVYMSLCYIPHQVHG